MHICFSHETGANYRVSEVARLLHLLSPCFCFKSSPFGYVLPEVREGPPFLFNFVKETYLLPMLFRDLAWIRDSKNKTKQNKKPALQNASPNLKH